MKKNAHNKKNAATQIFIFSLVFSLIIPTIAAAIDATNDMSTAKNSFTDSANVEQDDAPSYISASKSKYGWVYGTITDQAGNLLDLASIVIYRPAVSVTDAVNSRYVTYSGKSGTYRIAVLPGVYVIDAYKKGYSTDRETGVTIEKGNGTKVDFVLKKSTATTPGLGLLRGTVYGVMQVSTSNSADAPSTTVKIPLKGARVSIYSLTPSLTAANADIVATGFTDGNGTYELKLAPGTYSAVASKGVAYHQQKVTIAETRITELNFVLKIQNTAVDVDNSISAGDFGGEITVQKDPNDQTYTHDIVIYDGVLIEPITISSTELSIQVSGDDTSLGKTIAIHLDLSSFSLGDTLDVQYDGEPITQAENLEDILDPNNDGLHPEYLIILGANNSAEILVSIPHFSEHTITISSLVEAVGGITSLIMYGAVLAVVAVLYVAPMWFLRKK